MRFWLNCIIFVMSERSVLYIEVVRFDGMFLEFFGKELGIMIMVIIGVLGNVLVDKLLFLVWFYDWLKKYGT